MNKPPAISTIPLVRQLADTIRVTQEVASIAHLPRGSVKGKVVDVDDPLGLGRVKVEFENMDKDTPQVTGGGEEAGERTGQGDVSHWIDVCPAFKGKQPPGLVGKRVCIDVANGEYQYAVLRDVLFDPQNQSQTAGSKMEMPDNSSMTRLPLYPSGQLPPATKENHGCAVIEMDGPLDSDWLCICLKRQGSYYWVRHIDLAHGHAGENDGKQPNDTHGDGEFPVEEQTVWDYVFPTTGGEMQKYSRYGTSPRANPFGGQAKWYEPPK